MHSKMQDMLKNMQKAQQKIQEIIVTGQSGGGLVKIDIDGQHQACKVVIDDSIMDDKGMLEDLVLAAINDATTKLEDEVKKSMLGFAGDFKLP